MATNEAGWFYHAPARRQNKEPAFYPAMSQVPGLAEDDGPPEEPPRSLFRDTDTKYVRLAKEGGRANLLEMKENERKEQEPVYYPRTEWFYLDDNALEDEAERKKNEGEYDFLRPDYMVHEKHKPSEWGERPGRGPISHDKLSVFEREPGKAATDKTVKLPEFKKQGYGVRSGKPLRVPRSKPNTAQTDPDRGPQPQKYLSMPTTDSPDKPRIGKILGYAYEREWQEQLKEWQGKQDAGHSRHHHMTNVEEQNFQTEYNTSYGKRSAVVHSDLNRPKDTQQSSRPSEGKQAFSVRQTETQRLREARLQKPAEKDPFKMTRFKNISARIETHRHMPVA